MKIKPTLLKEFEINKAIEKIQNELNSYTKEFIVIRNNIVDYDVNAKNSFGIGMSTQNNFSLPITTNMKLKKVDSANTKIILKTSFRIELLIIIILWIGITLTQIVGNVKIPIWVTIVLFPIILLWFGFIYRSQEEILHQKIEYFLKRI